MRYYKIIDNGYLVAVGNGNGGEEIAEAEYAELLDTIHSKPSAKNGFDYRLKANLEWEKYELPQIEETETTYTAERLEQMTSTELKAICIELGIPTSMVKQNMIDLILGKQNEVI